MVADVLPTPDGPYMHAMPGKPGVRFTTRSINSAMSATLRSGWMVR